jgi:MerR family transcriptional regulator, thiopeptide resistance regulator
MQTQTANLRQIKAFADGAGVTVRTLHLYDRLGLLKPAALSESGYRLYGEAELERLEHILALRFIGFNLEQIKELLQGSNRPLVVALRMQRDVIAAQKRRLESALAAIDEAERALSGDAPADRWETLRTVIEVFKMQNDWSWTQEYYSEEARQKLEEYRNDTPREVVEQGQRDWTALIAEVEAAASSGIDPSSAQAQVLAQRWRDLLAQFTRSNTEIQRGLNRLWSEPTHWPAGFKRPWSDEADAFIKKAMSCGN